MEVRKKKRLSRIFITYIIVFCINTLVLFAFVLILFSSLITDDGLILPANYSETLLEDAAAEIETSGIVTKDLIPDGCEYAVYDKKGEFQYGTLEAEEQTYAWKAYRAERKSALGGGYYKFFERENNEEICVIKYWIAARFHSKMLSWLNPDLAAGILFAFLFLAQAILVSRRFGIDLGKKLKVLENTADKIQKQDLEFSREHSDIAEIEEILSSIFKMRDALSRSLEIQWDNQRKMTEQISALAHDIKTPLTVIKGNAELLSEEDMEEAAKKYPLYIQKNVKVIEDYLAQLSELLEFEERTPVTEIIDCVCLAEKLSKQAKALAASQGKSCKVSMQAAEGKICCDAGQILRAWNNIVMNGLSYTPEGESICIQTGISQRGKYLYAEVRDRGPGFTEEGLNHAAEKFYQGDKSRHQKDHKGIGLYIASEFARIQGGKVEIENAQEEGYGGKVTLYLRMER